MAAPMFLFLRLVSLIIRVGFQSQIHILLSLSELCRGCGGGCDQAGIHDTVVSKTSSEPRQDRYIILVGYAEKVHELLDRANPGLRSRFPLEDAFEFRDYEATGKAKHVASRVVARARDCPGFRNDRDVHNLVNRARAESGPVVLEPVDFDPHWEKEWGTADCKELLQEFVGFENIIEQFQGYQEVVAGMRLHGKHPHQSTPFSFVFKGPPGTGKTSAARMVGQIFFDIGFLASDEVIECSASDLIGQHNGHTAPLVQALLEKALGKVLFIDEAYRLSPGAREIVILAGYSDDMDLLMKSNRGLQGRFATELIGKLDITIFDKREPGDEEKEKVYRLIRKLGATRDWSNGRDIETLANIVIGKVFHKE
ncbi:P-loop containing nucleoside triphosphate hydrolase protein [Lasiosphaeria hispida]|uniref:P-loop containing nucleoside triphosphate hydrolase protein n=1 Tax=Lasiosphaeria hispida TaxID=260671 RepID=A0AAJ0HBB3_9PEZI|nr:P-loop containing nucleoside triphosphate hydrolase protein [Lasiosphaeria hispida]